MSRKKLLVNEKKKLQILIRINYNFVNFHSRGGSLELISIMRV